MRPSAKPRSMSAASRVASPEAVAFPAGSATGFAAAGLARGAALDAVLCAVLLVVLAAAVLGDDINSVLLLDHLVLPQLELAVGHAFAGLHVVFIAVPGTDEMHLGVREVEPARGLVRHDPLFDLGDGQALAGRSALMQAEIAVGVELPLVPEHTDLVVADKNDAAVAVLELRKLTDELLGHTWKTSLLKSGGPASFERAGRKPARPQYAPSATQVQSAQAVASSPRT